LGSTLAGAGAEMREAQDLANDRDPEHLPYCAVSCGVIIHTLGDKSKNVKGTVVHVEGDPDHPISRGCLCPKGATLKNDITHHNRSPCRRCAARVPIIWRKFRGKRHRRHLEPCEGHRAIAPSSRKNARAKWSIERPASPGLRCTDTNEFTFLQWKAITAWEGSLPRFTGQGLTRPPRWPVWPPRLVEER